MRIFIVGYFGFGIVGDEAILVSLLDYLENLDPQIEIVITSSNIKRSQLDARVRAIEIGRMSAVIKEIYHADLVVVAGGGCFNEYSSWDNDSLANGRPDYNVLCGKVSEVASSLNRRVFICGVGIEPLKSLDARNAVIRGLNAAEVVTLRDEESFNSLELQSQIGSEVYVTACPALSLDFAIENENDSKNRNKLLIGVSLRYWNFDDLFLKESSPNWEKIVADDLKTIAAKLECLFVFIPFQSENDEDELSNDLPIINRVIRSAGIESQSSILESSSPKEILSLINSCDLMIACRYHSIIFAISAQIPFVTLSYSRKVSSAAKMAGLSEYVLDLSSIVAGQLSKNVFDLVNNFQEIKQKLGVNSGSLKKASRENFLILKRLIDLRGRGDALRRVDEIVFQSLLSMYLRNESKRDFLESNEELVIELVLLIEDTTRSSEVYSLIQNLPSDMRAHPQIKYLFALAAQMSGASYTETKSLYIDAINSGASKYWAYYNLGFLELQNKYYWRAVRVWKKAIKLEPELIHNKTAISNELKRNIKQPLYFLWRFIK